MKIYTKTGDDGSTGLFSGRRVKKSSSFVEAYGSVDELNSLVGWVKSVCDNELLCVWLDQIQHDLFVVGSDLATPLDQKAAIERTGQSRIDQIEKWIDECESKLSPLKSFILPGGVELAARLHFARTVARTAERRLVAHAAQNEVNEVTMVYLNRLSDLFFVMARLANHLKGQPDIPWDQSR